MSFVKWLVNSCHRMEVRFARRRNRCEACATTITTKVYRQYGSAASAARGFRCDICKKVFSVYKALKKHRHIHTGEKPYLCQTCLTRFANNSSLKKHTHEQNFQCDRCGERFSWIENLEQHIENDHSAEDS